MKKSRQQKQDLRKTVERIMDAGFDPAIRNLMNDDVHEMLVEKALDGDHAAQTTYLDRFMEVVGEIDRELRRFLIRGIILHGPERGVEEFLEDVGDCVLLFENEVLDMLKDHIRQGHLPMEEPVEVELEEEVALPDNYELIFRFWAPGEGTEPVAEFTALNPDTSSPFLFFIRDGIHDVVAASWIPYLRRVVEETLHDLQKKQEGGE